MGAVRDQAANPEPMTLEEIAQRHQQLNDDLDQQLQELQRVADGAFELAEDTFELADGAFGDDIAHPDLWPLQA